MAIGNVGDKIVPTKITAVTGFTSINSGWYHTTFLKNDSTAYSCGRSLDGSLGINDVTNPTFVPTLIPGFFGVQKFVPGISGSILLENGTIYGMGTPSVRSLQTNSNFFYSERTNRYHYSKYIFCS